MIKIESDKDLLLYEMPRFADYMAAPWLQDLIGRYLARKTIKKSERFIVRKQKALWLQTQSQFHTNHAPGQNPSTKQTNAG